jgi:23S rRNA pseudouridine1911/1915/1917 synthase
MSPPSSAAQHFTVPAAEAGQRLDHFLAHAVPSLSRSRIQALIKEGHISLNGAATKPGARLRTGDGIEVVVPAPKPAEMQPEAIALSVLFEDEDLIVLDKPVGMVVHPAAGNWEGTLVHALLHHCRTLSGVGGELRPGIVHRLDKETSGCIVAAKNDSAHQSLARQFAGREVTKIYLALVAGRFAKKSGLIEAAIGRHPVHRQKMAVVERGRASKTEWRALRELPAAEAPGGIATLVECTLHTGRTHQIRVHLKHLGHPLLGDETYGRRAGFPRQMLHAWQLGFTHPRTGERVRFSAPMPPDFLAAGAPAQP